MLLVFGMLLICEKAALANLYPFTTIDNPSVTDATYIQEIDARDQVVGYFFDDTGAPGSLDAAGTATTLDDFTVNSWIFTFAIKDTKPSQGFFDDATGRYGFLDTDGDGATLNFPWAAGGTVTIRVYDRIGGRHSSAEPGVPEPNTLPLLAVCLAVLAVAFRRN